VGFKRSISTMPRSPLFCWLRSESIRTSSRNQLYSAGRSGSRRQKNREIRCRGEMQWYPCGFISSEIRLRRLIVFLSLFWLPEQVSLFRSTNYSFRKHTTRVFLSHKIDQNFLSYRFFLCFFVLLCC
jgi:hypothetical protein